MWEGAISGAHCEYVQGGCGVRGGECGYRKEYECMCVRTVLSARRFLLSLSKFPGVIACVQSHYVSILSNVHNPDKVSGCP